MIWERIRERFWEPGFKTTWLRAISNGASNLSSRWYNRVVESNSGKRLLKITFAEWLIPSSECVYLASVGHYQRLRKKTWLRPSPIGFYVEK